jgi:hypothetical protein
MSWLDLALPPESSRNLAMKGMAIYIINRYQVGGTAMPAWYCHDAACIVAANYSADSSGRRNTTGVHLQRDLLRFRETGVWSDYPAWHHLVFLFGGYLLVRPRSSFRPGLHLALTAARSGGQGRPAGCRCGLARRFQAAP